MRYFISFVLVVMGIFLSPLRVAQATSTDIQMLPPTSCLQAGLSDINLTGILAWDTTNPLGCVSGFTADSGGNISATGAFYTSGTNAGFAAYDRNGNTNVSILYRNNNVTALWDNVYGNVITYNAAGNVGIGTATPNSSLDLSARTDGISMPRGTTAQQPASPTPGMTRYNTSTDRLEYWNGSSWITVASVPSSNTCVKIYGTNTDTVKEPCGFVSRAYCPTGTTAVAGGMVNGGNDSTQDSEMLIDGITGTGNGWYISVLDNAYGGTCHINSIPDGTTASGTSPNLHFTYTDGTAYGDSYVVCCH